MKIRSVHFIVVLSLLLLLLPLVTLLGIHRIQRTENPQKPEVLASRNIGSSQNVALLTPKPCSSSKVSVFTYQKGSTDPLLVQTNIGYTNNKFGLYAYSLKDYIITASDLVNSNGGHWGYVLIPYNVRDHDADKWRTIFKLFREKELIPIIQLWDVDLTDFRKETDEAVSFLNSQDWPIDKRYISVYNEPNDERFWKGRLDPEGYAEILDYTITAFKKADPRFFMLNGAFNATAPSHSGYQDEVSYMRAMEAKAPGIFSRLDGWASHSYPQPAYLGLPTDTGRGSIRTYEWELNVLANEFGLYNDLPVFITETGWPHTEGKEPDARFYDSSTVAAFYKEAFENVWLPDPRVVAVTPFTIFYQPPDDHFSWIHEDGKQVYPQYTTIQNIPKVAGDPTKLVTTEKTIFNCK